MKKLLFVVLLAVASITVYAQPRAIGARLGGFDGISYQHSFGESNMLEVIYKDDRAQETTDFLPWE